jgi:hypothetical protein
MIEELSVVAVTFLLNMLLKDLQLVGRVLYIILAFSILKFFPGKTRLLLQATLAWNVFELADAFLNLTNYDEEDYKCTSTASTSKSEKTDEKPQKPSSPEKVSVLNSSLLQMEESTHPEDSMSAPPSTDVQ